MTTGRISDASRRWQPRTHLRGAGEAGLPPEPSLSPREPAHASCTQERPNEVHEKLFSRHHCAQTLAGEEHSGVRSCPGESVLLDKHISLGPVPSLWNSWPFQFSNHFCPEGSRGNFPWSLAASDLHFQPESTSHSTGKREKPEGF